VHASTSRPLTFRHSSQLGHLSDSPLAVVFELELDAAVVGEGTGGGDDCPPPCPVVVVVLAAGAGPGVVAEVRLEEEDAVPAITPAVAAAATIAARARRAITVSRRLRAEGFRPRRQNGRRVDENRQHRLRLQRHNSCWNTRGTARRRGGGKSGHRWVCSGGRFFDSRGVRRQGGGRRGAHHLGAGRCQVGAGELPHVVALLPQPRRLVNGNRHARRRRPTRHAVAAAAAFAAAAALTPALGAGSSHHLTLPSGPRPPAACPPAACLLLLVCCCCLSFMLPVCCRLLGRQRTPAPPRRGAPLCGTGTTGRFGLSPLVEADGKRKCPPSVLFLSIFGKPRDRISNGTAGSVVNTTQDRRHRRGSKKNGQLQPRRRIDSKPTCEGTSAARTSI
jgi:hypothetical protein